MRTKPYTIFGILLIVAITIFGFQIGIAVKKGREFDRYLTVRGLAEKEVKATSAIWPLRFSVYAEKLPQLKQEIEKKRLIVQNYLTGLGLDGRNISYGLPIVADKEETRIKEVKTDLPRYCAIITLVVRSNDVDLVKKAIQGADALLEQGISISNNEYGEQIQFQYDKLNEVKPELIKEATAGARAAAEKFAQDSQAKVGSIRRAVQGAVEIHDKDVATPEFKILRVVTTVDFFLN